MLKPALEALKNALLASAQPITAAIHRNWAQQIIDELYNSDSRAAVLAGTTTTSPTLVAGDKVFIIRGAAGLLIDKTAFTSVIDSLQQVVTKVSHGFAVGDVLTLNGSGVPVKITNPTDQKFLGVVLSVSSTSVFRMAIAGYVTGLSGLTPGSIYYATASGTLSTTESDMPVLQAATATTGYLLSSGAGGQSMFKGVFPSSAALISAYPSADPGNYAYVDAGVGSDVQMWIWDDDDTTWKQSGSVSVIAWTDTVAGTVERSITAEAQNIVTRAAAGSSDSSNDDGRTPSEKGLVEMLLSFLSTAWTWAAKQTFTSDPRFSARTASRYLMTDANKDLADTAAASSSDLITGTDTVKPVTSAALKGFRDLVAATPSLSGSDLTCNCSDKQESGFYYATLTGNANIIFSNKSNSQVHHLVVAITGASIVLTFESDVRMARYMEAIGWDQSSKALTVSSVGTGDLHEFSFVRAGSIFIMRYDGPVRA